MRRTLYTSDFFAVPVVLQALDDHRQNVCRNKKKSFGVGWNIMEDINVPYEIAIERINQGVLTAPMVPRDMEKAAV